jgi:RNA polymerase-binding protein DksA
VAKTAAKKTVAKSTPAAKAPVRRNRKQPVATTTTGVRTVTAKKTATTKTAPSKVSKKAASPESLAVKEGEDPWTQAELDEVLADLHEHGDRLRTELHDQEEELAGLIRDAGDGAGQDQADLGATSFERDHELTVVNNSREMLAQTERALARIEDGTYGVCESCGEPIGKMRVMAFPRATLCMSCKQREERR